MPETPEQKMIRDVGARQERMLRARREKRNGLSAIAIFGLIGWTVVLPTLGGLAVGIWIDRHWRLPFSGAITFLVAGLAIGCVSAWMRIREDR